MVAGKRVALVIGVSSYAHTETLDKPTSDAKAVAEAFSRLGFDVDLQTNVDKTAMDAALIRFSDHLAGAAVGAFYFAGHGMQVDGVNYLLPTDARLTGDVALVAETVNLNTILGKMASNKRASLVFLDACRNNPLENNLSLGIRSFGQRGLARVEPPTGTLISFATKEGNIAADSAGAHSPYTTGLLKYLETPDLDVVLMLQRVRGDVARLTNNTQIPVEYNALLGELTLKPAPRQADASAPSAAPASGTVSMPADDTPAATFAATSPPSIPGQRPGQSFRDCPDCPEMTTVPAGAFIMGSPENEWGHSSDEGPQRKVIISRPFAIGRFEVTQIEWRAVKGDNPSYFNGADHNPVEYVSWRDAQDFVKKLSAKTGHSYRLPTEAEWEYAARAGTTTPFYFGENISSDQANYDGSHMYGSSFGGNRVKGIFRRRTTPVGSFPPNNFGLHDMHGNVSEWVNDCYVDNYWNLPTDGGGARGKDSCIRVSRGGAWNSSPDMVRSAQRSGAYPDGNNSGLGFRVVRDLPK